MNKLHVVATPIGNKGDISARAIETLKEVKYIFAEDTKHSSILMRDLGINTKMISLHKFNELSRVDEVIEKLQEGDIALISDAGTPTISDPGQHLVNKLKAEGIEVVSTPGPSAVIAALSVSGLLFDNFTFVGFVPRKQGQLETLIKEHNNSEVIVGYESPKRINKTLEMLEEINPEIKVTISREITKMFEETTTGTPAELKGREFKGEIVMMITNHKSQTEDIDKIIEGLIEQGLSNRSIVDFLTKTYGLRKNDVYERLKKYE